MRGCEHDSGQDAWLWSSQLCNASDNEEEGDDCSDSESEEQKNPKPDAKALLAAVKRLKELALLASEGDRGAAVALDDCMEFAPPEIRKLAKS